MLHTGRHIRHTMMFNNTNFPWSSSLSPDIRTVGHALRDAGHYTACKGKWHLTKDFETVNELTTAGTANGYARSEPGPGP